MNYEIIINEILATVSIPHLVLHGLMLLFIVYLLSMRPFKPTPNNDRLTEREEEELIKEWKPLPLAPQKLTPMQIRNQKNPLVISESNSIDNRITVNGKSNVLSMAKTNYLGLMSDQRINQVCEKTIRKYGVGSCGPRGFYGSIDVHLSLERRIAQFMKSPQAVVYSSSYATITSAIPAFSKIGDIIYADAGLSQSVQVGLTLSRSRVHYFKHNDVQDLARLLEQNAQKEQQHKGKLVRKFVVLEGIYYNTGDIAPLPQVMALKERYKFRVILEESHSIGVLGRTGRGLTEHYNMDVNEVEIVCASLGNSFAAGGGFCIGSDAVVHHQRLNAVGFVFSASLPPYLATAAEAAIDILDQESLTLLTRLSSNTNALHRALQKIKGFKVVSSPLSPVQHLQLSRSFGTRDEDDDFIESVVMKCLDEHALLVSRSKYVDSEKYLPPPSIRLCINSTTSLDDINYTIMTLNNVLNKLF